MIRLPLSAPMPWEQIEVEDVAILRPDPEPEFGPVSADVVSVAQDFTVVMPVEEIHDPGATLPPLVDEMVRDGLSHVESSSMPDFRILSADAPVEPPKPPLPIHIPLEALELVEPVGGGNVPYPSLRHQQKPLSICQGRNREGCPAVKRVPHGKNPRPWFPTRRRKWLERRLLKYR